MAGKEKTKEIDTTVFLEELQKKITVPEGEYKKFFGLWQIQKFNRNEFILKANEIPNFPFLF